jgi:hypothetical protein
MNSASEVKEHMEVLDSDGQHVGTVDRVEGDEIKLTKNDSSDGEHHFVPIDWVERIDGSVHLNRTTDEVMSRLA